MADKGEEQLKRAGKLAATKGTKKVIGFAAKKFYKILCIIGSTTLGSFLLMIFLFLGIAYILIAKEGTSSQGITTYTAFSPEVEAYRNDVMSYCEDYGIIEYTNHILAIMQVETGGTTLDPMNAGDKVFNDLFPRRRGYIEDPLYSIEVAVQEFKELLGLAEVNSIYDTDNLMLVYQAYHFDREYITYSQENEYQYSVEQAKIYLKNNANLPYYLRPSFASNVLTYITIQSGNVENFCYPVDEPFEVMISFGEDMANGTISTGTYFKTDGSCPVYAITDGLIWETTNSRSLTFEHGEYVIRYRELYVHEDYVPEKISDDEDEEDEWEEIYVEKGEQIGQTKQSGGNYIVFLSIMYNDSYVDPMTILNLTVTSGYDPDREYDSVRDAIVDYAKLWMSTPYVWGGTSLTSGVDCSGFMQQIYKNFGYSIPRTSREQAVWGGAVWSTTTVVPNVLEKGDLLFYENNEGTVNHVTMYIGDGMIIGAQSSKTGIRIVQYNYRAPVKAIRVIP